MKIHSLDEGLSSLERFLDGYNVSDIIRTGGYRRRLKAIYKRYHAFLTWQAYLQEKRPPEFRSSANYDTFMLFLNECVSDTCQGLFLWCQGLYKPAYLILRSGIENFFRAVGLSEEQAVQDVESTYELARIIRATDVLARSDEAMSQFNYLWTSYGELCKFVHTSDERHMSLTTAVGLFPRFERIEADDSASEMRRIITAYCALLCLMFTRHYRQFHHSDYDIISDVLPKAVRKRVAKD